MDRAPHYLRQQPRVLHGCVCSWRSARGAQDQVNILKSRLTEGGNLIFFPKGTSTPVTRIETFRLSQLAASELEGVRIQAVTCAYSHYEGEPID